MYNTTAVDLTNISKIWIYGSGSHATAAVLISIHAEHDNLNTGTYSAIPTSNADAWTSVDVSALSGNYYIRVGRFGSATSLTAKDYELYGER